MVNFLFNLESNPLLPDDFSIAPGKSGRQRTDVTLNSSDLYFDALSHRTDLFRTSPISSLFL